MNFYQNILGRVCGLNPNTEAARKYLPCDAPFEIICVYMITNEKGTSIPVLAIRSIKTGYICIGVNLYDVKLDAPIDNNLSSNPYRDSTYNHNKESI